jgi:hypothetical protein
MGQWTYTSQQTDPGGAFVVVFHTPGGDFKDATYFRNVPISIDQYSSGDPFSDAIAVLTFNQITGMDDLGQGDLEWLNKNANVDIFYIDEPELGDDVINSINQQIQYSYPPISDSNAIKNYSVFQGFVASFESTQSDTESKLSVQCQGALYQADRIISKPAYPKFPRLFENQIRDSINPNTHKSLRLKPVIYEFPEGWNTKFPTGLPTDFTPTGGKPGDNIVGYWDRFTGDFTSTLTGFIQSKLANMYTKKDSGVKPGDNWTLLLDNGRQPVLRIRSSETEPLFDLHYGQIGASFNLSSDFSKAVSVVYGEGTGEDGVPWKGTDIAPDGTTTIYTPIGYINSAFPETTTNTDFNKNQIINETYVRYDAGMNFQQASDAAALKIKQFSSPGWTGTIDISIDPNFTDPSYTSRWQLKAGFSIRVRNIFGSGPEGIIFHVAQVTASPGTGSVSLTVDTNYRDLLTLDEVAARTREVLTPTKMLRIGQSSVQIQDQFAPWNKKVGSGCIPTKSKDFFTDNVSAFPWVRQAALYPPATHPQFYVKVDANARNSKNRWSFFKIVLSERGEARLTELAAYKWDGTPAKVAFHFGIYLNVAITADTMPHNLDEPMNTSYSPFRTYAFTTIDENGVPWSTNDKRNILYQPANEPVVAWGNKNQKAGYWPGQSSFNSPASGLLKDEGPWGWNFDEDPNIGAVRIAGNKPKPSKIPITAYSYSAAIYCEAPFDVYFVGRILRREPAS